MCGIAGILYADAARPIDRAALKRMADAIAHRGPDAEGYWCAPGVGLAHRRLSIIDLAGGQQPLGNEDESVQVVFNGEIYNYQELQERLLANGHKLRTSSDTEVLVHLYEEMGAAMVEELRGMFAFALWDSRERRLLLARDRVGIKPLYVYRDHEKVLFGSELKAILAHRGVPREIDVEALEDYLALACIPGRRSIFKRIEKVPAAHYVLIDAHLEGSPRRYWELRFQPDERPSADEWQEAVAAKIDESLRCHLLADVPVGAFLSGGLDSSLIVASAAQQTAGSGPLQTFSIGFREEHFSELPYARQVAERYSTRHVEEVVTPDAAMLVDELAYHYDEPFADSSALPTYLVARLASQHVKVVLSGDGGDEAFGGYTRYAHDLAEAKWREHLPSWFRRAVLTPLAAAWPRAEWLPRRLRAKTRLTNLALEADEAYANTLVVCRRSLRRELTSTTTAAVINGYRPEQAIAEAFRLGWRSAGGKSRAARASDQADFISGMLAADTALLLPDDFLTKVDRASMAHGLEVRPPLVDHELLELAARMPSTFKVRDGETKWLLKRTASKRLPGDVIWRRKRGFEIPVDAWLRGPLREMFEDTVLARASHVGDLLNRDQVARLYRSHLRLRGRQGAVLWSVLMLAKWMERWL